MSPQLPGNFQRERAGVLAVTTELNRLGLIWREEHNFLFDYVQFLVEQQIADVDISDCLIDWIDRGMHPTFIAALTARGRKVVQLIHAWQERLTAEGRLKVPDSLSIAQETFIRMNFRDADFVRMPFIREFGRLIAGRTIG